MQHQNIQILLEMIFSFQEKNKVRNEILKNVTSGLNYPSLTLLRYIPLEKFTDFDAD